MPANSSMRYQAVVLARRNTAAEEPRVARLLGFFGVESRLLSAADLSRHIESGVYGSAKVRVLGSAEAFLQLIECLDRHSSATSLWQERIHSAFVYAAGNSSDVQEVLCRLSGDGEATVAQVGPITGRVAITDKMNEFCGVMSGITVDASSVDTGTSVVFRSPRETFTSVVSTRQGPTVAKLQYKDVPVFMSGCGSLVDIDAELTTRNFDIREHFLTAVPIVLYTKWAFASTCWHAPATSACVVIDDPLLKRNYGFVNFEKLLVHMDEHQFSTNIAFIPWNWKRSERGVVRLFTGRPDRYSLSVHGCDHTGEEFGGTDLTNLQGKVARARERMSRHERRTGIHHDPVMVFPQGVFSRAAMGVLKRSAFVAAVNTEVMSVDKDRPSLRLSDVWDVAVMNYESFPIFTRRYPAQGVENFAFDILLGKPCVVVIHHDYCSDEYSHLTAFVRALNALNCSLTWCNLGEVVRRGCRRRELSESLSEIEMYGTRLWIENQSEGARRFIVTRREAEPSSVREGRLDSRPIEWTAAQGRISFQLELAAGEGTEIDLVFHSLGEDGRHREKTSYVAKAIVRRYLSEIRDNYVVTRKLGFARLFKRLIN